MYTSNVNVSARLSPSAMLSNLAASALASQLAPATTFTRSLSVISTPTNVSVFGTSFTNTSLSPASAVTSGRPNTTMVKVLFAPYTPLGP